MKVKQLMLHLYYAYILHLFYAIPQFILFMLLQLSEYGAHDDKNMRGRLHKAIRYTYPDMESETKTENEQTQIVVRMSRSGMVIINLFLQGIFYLKISKIFTNKNKRCIHIHTQEEKNNILCVLHQSQSNLV